MVLSAKVNQFGRLPIPFRVLDKQTDQFCKTAAGFVQLSGVLVQVGQEVRFAAGVENSADDGPPPAFVETRMHLSQRHAVGLPSFHHAYQFAEQLGAVLLGVAFRIGDGKLPSLRIALVVQVDGDTASDQVAADIGRVRRDTEDMRVLGTNFLGEAQQPKRKDRIGNRPFQAGRFDPWATAAGFGVVDDDRGPAAADDGPQTLLELLIVGIVGCRLRRLAITENGDDLGQDRFTQFGLITVEQRGGLRADELGGPGAW